MVQNHPSIVPMHHSSTSIPQPHRLIHSGLPDNLEQRHDAAQPREYTCTVRFSGKGSIGILRRDGERKLSSKQRIERQTNLVGIEYQHLTVDGSLKLTVVPVVPEATLPSYLVRSFNPSQRLEMLDRIFHLERYKRYLERTDPDKDARRIAQGLTLRGKQRIEDGISLLAHKYGQRRLGFYTLTCPYDDADLIQRFNNSFPEIVRRFQQEVKRVYEREGLQYNYVGVYEIQEQRYRRTGQQCLHLHYIAPACLPSGKFVLCHGDLVHLYSRVLARVIGEGLHGNPRVDAQLVRANASGYLSKYFSKGIFATDDDDGQRTTVSLSSWYTMSRSLLRACKQSVLQLPGFIADDIYRAAMEGKHPKWLKYCSPVRVEIDGIERVVGVVFTVCDSFRDMLREIVFPQVEHLL